MNRRGQHHYVHVLRVPGYLCTPATVKHFNTFCRVIQGFCLFFAFFHAHAHSRQTKTASADHLILPPILYRATEQGSDRETVRRTVGHC